MTKSSAKDFLETLQIAEKSVSRERYQRLSAIGLTVAQAKILIVVQGHGALSLNELSAALPTDTPPSRVVSTLVDRRLVTRRDQASDRRHVTLTLSALGEKKITEIRRVDRAINRWAARKLLRVPVKAAQKALLALAAQ